MAPRFSQPSSVGNPSVLTQVVPLSAVFDTYAVID
jgi:hypothetical protein